jgi:hypothetical protein
MGTCFVSSVLCKTRGSAADQEKRKGPLAEAIDRFQISGGPNWIDSLMMVAANKSEEKAEADATNEEINQKLQAPRVSRLINTKRLLSRDRTLQTDKRLGTRRNIRWTRLVIAAFLLEVVLFIVLIPVRRVFGDTVFLISVPVGCIVFGFLSGMWAVRPLRSGFLLHGFLLGILATILYMGLLVIGDPAGFLGGCYLWHRSFPAFECRQDRGLRGWLHRQRVKRSSIDSGLGRGNQKQ